MDRFRFIADEEFQARYGGVWSTILMTKPSVNDDPSFRAQRYATWDLIDWLPFAQSNWQLALIPAEISASRITYEEYDWEGTFPGLDNFHDPMIWTWRERALERVIFAQIGSFGEANQDLIKSPDDFWPLYSADMEASYRGFNALAQYFYDGNSLPNNRLAPSASGCDPFVLFDESGDWAYYETLEPYVSILGGTPDFMADFFRLGGGKEATIRRFQFFDITWGIELDYMHPNEGAAIRKLYDLVGWPVPDYPDERPVDRENQPPRDSYGNLLELNDESKDIAQWPKRTFVR